MKLICIIRQYCVFCQEKQFFSFFLFTYSCGCVILNGMKKVIEVEGMCCKRCAERAERKLRLLEGVKGAKANFKKQMIFVESELPDEALVACVVEAGFGVKAVRPRKGIFG